MTAPRERPNADETPRRETHEIRSRAEWLALRRCDITASRVAALFDAHPYLSRDDLAASLRGVDQGDNPAMRRGRILEPGIAVALAEDHPDWEITKANTYHRLPDLRLGCTPDMWLGDDGLVQLKTVSPEKFDEWHSKPPLAYTLQTLTELLVTGRTCGVLAVMVMSRSLPVYEFDVPRHPAAEQRILDAVADWWRAWDAGEIAAPADAAGLDEMLDDGETIDLSADNAIRGLLEEHIRISAIMSATKKELGAIDHQIKTRIGKARAAFVPGYNVTFATQKRKEIPASQYRVLRIKETGTDNAE